MVVGNAEGLGIWSVGTVEVIDASTESQAVTTVGDFLGKEPLLAELDAFWVGVEAVGIRMGVVSDACPTADVEACDRLLDEFPRIGQGTTRTEHSQTE